MIFNIVDCAFHIADMRATSGECKQWQPVYCVYCPPPPIKVDIVSSTCHAIQAKAFFPFVSACNESWVSGLRAVTPSIWLKLELRRCPVALAH